MSTGNLLYPQASFSSYVNRDALHRFPFLYDTVWDLMRVLDWMHTLQVIFLSLTHSSHISDPVFPLSHRDFFRALQFVDTSRVGATGISLGGMHSWLWAAADTRVTSTCPAIGVQVAPTLTLTLSNTSHMACTSHAHVPYLPRISHMSPAHLPRISHMSPAHAPTALWVGARE